MALLQEDSAANKAALFPKDLMAMITSLSKQGDTLNEKLLTKDVVIKELQVKVAALETASDQQEQYS